MKITKWFLFAAAALVYCGACNPNDIDEDPTQGPDKISISPKASAVSSKGGELSVLVTSSDEWTLTGDVNDYVTPSVTKGVDGDIAMFMVKANDKETDQTFNYTFTCGKEKAPYVITLKKKASQTEEQLEVAYAPESNILTREGGEVSVLVTSSDEWMLEGSYTFVRPSITTGEDGAEVVFTVDPNETEANKVADYVFKMGNKKVDFQITLQGGVIYSVEIVGEKSLKFAYTKQERVAVTLNTNVPYRDLAAEITSTVDAWLTKGVTMQGASETQAIMYFDLTQNDALEARDATVKITGPDGGEDILTIKQMPQSKLSVDVRSYYLDIPGASLEVPVTANVEFDVTLSESAADWFTYGGIADGKLKFTYQNLPAEVKVRMCEVTLTEKNAPEGIDPLVVVLSFSQKVKGSISTVVNMTQTRAWPAWTDPTPVNALSDFTVETLLYGNTWQKSGSASTILGIEDHFLIRVGDLAPKNRLQVATASGGGWNPERLNVFSDKTLLEAKRWYHLIVTVSKGNIKIYIDGELAAEGTNSKLTTVNLGVPHNNETGTTIKRCFWVGYSFEPARYLDGMLSETRIWNRVLTADEIANVDRRYDVAPNTNGLVTYWKFDEGEGNVVKDHTSYGNDLASDGLAWEPVSLP